MLFVQFYIDKTVKVGVKLPEKAIGDNAIFEITKHNDAKITSQIAKRECIIRGFDSWCIFSGDSITNAKPVSCIYGVNRKEDKTAFSAYYGA